MHFFWFNPDLSTDCCFSTFDYKPNTAWMCMCVHACLCVVYTCVHAYVSMLGDCTPVFVWVDAWLFAFLRNISITSIITNSDKYTSALNRAQIDTDMACILAGRNPAHTASHRAGRYHWSMAYMLLEFDCDNTIYTKSPLERINHDNVILATCDYL